MHLREILAGLGPQHALGDIGESRHAARAIGAELTVILRLDFARVIFLYIAAFELPFAAQRGETLADIDLRIGIGVGAGGVVDADRRLASRGLKVDLAHGNLAVSDVDLAAAADGAGGDANFQLAVDVGHAKCLLKAEAVFRRSGPTTPSADANRFRFNGSGGDYPTPLSQSGSPGMAGV